MLKFLDTNLMQFLLKQLVKLFRVVVEYCSDTKNNTYENMFVPTHIGFSGKNLYFYRVRDTDYSFVVLPAPLININISVKSNEYSLASSRMRYLKNEVTDIVINN